MKAVRSLLLLCLVVFFAACSVKSTLPQGKNQFTIHCFKIGKADSFLVKTENSTLLIDTGEDEDAEEILSYLAKNNITNLDYLIISHFDKDHVGGADKILNAVSVNSVIQPNHTKDSNDVREYTQALEALSITPVVPNDVYSFNLDNAEFTIYPPQSDSYEEDESNNSSLAVSIHHGINSFLFTGDAMDERITELVSNSSLEHILIKMPHHGKYTENLPNLIQAVNPQYAIITSSNKNPEDNETISLLNDYEVKIYYTKNGSIDIISNGENLKIYQ